MEKLKKTIGLIVLFVIASVIIAVVVDHRSGDTQNEVNLYFLGNDSSVLVAKKEKIDAENPDEMCKKVLEALIKGPSGKNYSPIMDSEVSVNRISNENGDLTVDFSEKYEETGLLSTYAVIKTLCQLPGVTKVCVTCSGRNVMPDGFVSGDEINLESDADCSTPMRLYFADSTKTKLVREFRMVNITDTQPVEVYIVNELIKGPKVKNNERILSDDTGVISVETTDGTCYVNFKKDFAAKNSQQPTQLVIYSIVNSLTERENVNNVQFLIDGKKTDKFDSINIENPIYRNEGIIE